MTYQDVVAFSESWGGVYFMIMFLVALTYALWPSKRAEFDQAARIPLEDDGDL